ncbi:MAG TPA: hypothetical protein PKK26_13550, partial [Candidatus Wallbacteria bacterium]|nr:hypothetical protein [Candidatus Wallbacteria bacterium]
PPSPSTVEIYLSDGGINSGDSIEIVCHWNAATDQHSKMYGYNVDVSISDSPAKENWYRLSSLPYEFTNCAINESALIKSGVPEAGTYLTDYYGLKEKYIFYPETGTDALKWADKWRYVSKGTYLGEYFKSHGFTSVNTYADIATKMSAITTANTAKDSIFVLPFGVMPWNIFDYTVVGYSNTIAKKYLDKGGSILWIGDFPLDWSYDNNTQYKSNGNIIDNLLGVRAQRVLTGPNLAAYISRLGVTLQPEITDHGVKLTDIRAAYSQDALRGYSWLATMNDLYPTKGFIRYLTKVMVDGTDNEALKDLYNISSFGNVLASYTGLVQKYNYYTTVTRGPSGYYYKFRVTSIDAQGNISPANGFSPVKKAKDTKSPVVEFGYGVASDYQVQITKAILATDIWSQFTVTDSQPSAGIDKLEWFFEIANSKQTWDYPNNKDFHTVTYFDSSSGVYLNVPCNREIVSKAPWYPTRNRFTRAGTYRVFVRAYDKDGNYNVNYAWQTYKIIASEPYRLVFADPSSLKFDVQGRVTDYIPLTKNTNFKAPYFRAGTKSKYYIVSADKDFDVVTIPESADFVKFTTDNITTNDQTPMASARIYHGLESSGLSSVATPLDSTNTSVTVEPVQLGVASVWSKGLVTVEYYETRDINADDNLLDSQIIISSPAFSVQAIADIEIRPDIFHHLKFDQTLYEMKADEGLKITFDRRDKFGNLVYSSNDTEAVAVNFINEYGKNDDKNYTIGGASWLVNRLNFEVPTGGIDSFYWNSRSGNNASLKGPDDKGWYPWEVASAETESVGIAFGNSGNFIDGHSFRIELANYELSNTAPKTYFYDASGKKIRLICNEPGRLDRYDKHQFILNKKASAVYYNDTLASLDGPTRLTAYIFGYDSTEAKFKDEKPSQFVEITVKNSSAPGSLRISKNSTYKYIPGTSEVALPNEPQAGLFTKFIIEATDRWGNSMADIRDFTAVLNAHPKNGDRANRLSSYYGDRSISGFGFYDAAGFPISSIKITNGSAEFYYQDMVSSHNLTYNRKYGYNTNSALDRSTRMVIEVMDTRIVSGFESDSQEIEVANNKTDYSGYKLEVTDDPSNSLNRMAGWIGETMTVNLIDHYGNLCDHVGTTGAPSGFVTSASPTVECKNPTTGLFEPISGSDINLLRTNPSPDGFQVGVSMHELKLDTTGVVLRLKYNASVTDLAVPPQNWTPTGTIDVCVGLIEPKLWGGVPETYYYQELKKEMFNDYIDKVTNYNKSMAVSDINYIKARHPGFVLSGWIKVASDKTFEKYCNSPYEININKAEIAFEQFELDGTTKNKTTEVDLVGA